MNQQEPFKKPETDDEKAAYCNAVVSKSHGYTTKHPPETVEGESALESYNSANRVLVNYLLLQGGVSRADFNHEHDHVPDAQIKNGYYKECLRFLDNEIKEYHKIRDPLPEIRLNRWREQTGQTLRPGYQPGQ